MNGFATIACHRSLLASNSRSSLAKRPSGSRDADSFFTCSIFFVTMSIYIFKLRQNYRTGSTNLIKGPTLVTSSVRLWATVFDRLPGRHMSCRCDKRPPVGQADGVASSLRSQNAAVYRDDGAGDEARARGREKHSQIRNIGGGSQAPERNSLQYLGPHLVGKHGTRHRRVSNGRRNGVDGDPVGAEFAGKSHGQGHNTGFGCSVKSVADRSSTAHCRYRSNIDDSATAPPTQDHNRGLRAIKHARQVDIAHLLPLRRR